MTIADLDKNFQVPKLDVTDIEWFDASEEPFSLHGIYFNKEEGIFRRMPQDVADTVSFGVSYFSRYSTGGRLRFKTDSPYVAIKCILPPEQCMPHMPFTGSHGFSLYVNGEFKTVYYTVVKDAYDNLEKPWAMQSIKQFNRTDLRDNELYFPLYNGVQKLYIGLKKGCKLLKADDYTYKKPIVFYGSSITQGGCASRTGNDYISHLGRMLDCDYINLGFSGNAKGEPTMVNYLASLDAGVFVIDYDHNAPSLEHLKETHYPLYETIRKAHPDTPMVFISAPSPEFKEQGYERRDLIKSNVEKAKALGDNNVYFIPGESLFGTEFRDACTVDCCHPNDIGFLRMAQTIYPVLKEILENK